jgi:anaerobic ribonucleoside-triphosphate reductase activating protein
MRFASMRNLDISNGEGVGVSLFVQGCDRHCFNCFNPDTWDFNGGKEWTEEAKNKFIKLIDRPYINRISVLGGEPLAEQNLDEVLSLIKEIRISLPDKTIWLYTGFRWNYIMNYQPVETDDFDYIEESYNDGLMEKRKRIISLCDVVIDGEYIDEQKDLTLKWRGSKNQHVIDVNQSLAQNKMVLYCD